MKNTASFLPVVCLLTFALFAGCDEENDERGVTPDTTSSELVGYWGYIGHYNAEFDTTIFLENPTGPYWLFNEDLSATYYSGEGSSSYIHYEWTTVNDSLLILMATDSDDYLSTPYEIHGDTLSWNSDFIQTTEWLHFFLRIE